MSDFIAIDFETANNSPSSAISIGLVKYRDYEKTDSFYSLIRPPNLYVRPDFTDIHGLTAEDVKDSPKFEQIWNNIYDFLEGGDGAISIPLVAHCAPFDMGVLKATLEHYDLPLPKLSYFCSRNLARAAWPGFDSYALTKLAKRFGIVYNAHNALDDAETCGKLVQMSAEIFGKEKSIKQLVKAAKIKLCVFCE